MKVKNARFCANCGNVFGKGQFACPHCKSTLWFHLDRFVPDPEDLEHMEPDTGTWPEQESRGDPPRSFFARLWDRLTNPFRIDLGLPTA